MTRLNLKHLGYEALERQYWAEDDHRWGRRSTTWFGFWLLALGGRIRDFLRPSYRWRVQDGDQAK